MNRLTLATINSIFLVLGTAACAAEEGTGREPTGGTAGAPPVAGSGGAGGSTAGGSGGSGGPAGSPSAGSVNGGSAGQGGMAGAGGVAGAAGASAAGGSGGTAGSPSAGSANGGSAGQGGMAGAGGVAGAAGGSAAGGSGGDPMSGVPKLSTHVAPLLNTSCALADCHDATKKEHGMDFSATPAEVHEMLVDHMSADHCNDNATVVRVVPGDPESSYLIQLVDAINRCDEVPRMPPPPLEALDPAEIQMIRDWIAAGAQND